MYIWVGIDVDEQLRAVKHDVWKIEQALHFTHSNFTLPFHVSLKMSFRIDDHLYGDVTDNLCDFLSSVDPFDISVSGIECEDTIVWIAMRRGAILDGLHDSLNTLMKEKYGVPLHEYDTDYKFHTTLFMDSDRDKIKRAYELIRRTEIPDTLRAERFAVGCSDSGALGTYRIIREITGQQHSPQV